MRKRTVFRRRIDNRLHERWIEGSGCVVLRSRHGTYRVERHLRVAHEDRSRLIGMRVRPACSFRDCKPKTANRFPILRRPRVWREPAHHEVFVPDRGPGVPQNPRHGLCSRSERFGHQGGGNAMLLQGGSHFGKRNFDKLDGTNVTPVFVDPCLSSELGQILEAVDRDDLPVQIGSGAGS
jgi:hypothetical protein